MTKQSNIKSPSKAPQNLEDSWVDVHDSSLMIELGIHYPYAVPRDPSVWTKTNEEREELKSLRCRHKGRIHFYTAPVNKSIPVKAKLIIYLKKNKKFPNTTYSTTCWQNEIGNILGMYCHDNKAGYSESVVQKYTYNGKEYKPGERPFWY